MEWISRKRFVMKMMMMGISVTFLILSVLLIVEAKDYQAGQDLSPHPPRTNIPFSLAFNSSEDNINFEKFIPKTVRAGNQIFYNLKNLGSRIQHTVGLGKGSSSESTPAKKNGSNLVGVTYGFHLKKGDNLSPMEDYIVAETLKIGAHVVGLFAVFDGYMSHDIPAYLQSHLFNNIIKSPHFLTNPKNAVRKGYLETDNSIQEQNKTIGFRGLSASTAVTAILMKQPGQSKYKLVVANVGDSQAVICCKNGLGIQLSVNHFYSSNEIEREAVRKRGSYVSEVFPLSRAFGVTSLKEYVVCEPHVLVEMIDGETEFLVLASRPLWKMMTNQDVVNSIRKINNAKKAAMHLTKKATKMSNYALRDDISCVVVRFR